MVGRVGTSIGPSVRPKTTTTPQSVSVHKQQQQTANIERTVVLSFKLSVNKKEVRMDQIKHGKGQPPCGCGNKAAGTVECYKKKPQMVKHQTHHGQLTFVVDRFEIVSGKEQRTVVILCERNLVYPIAPAARPSVRPINDFHPRSRSKRFPGDFYFGRSRPCKPFPLEVSSCCLRICYQTQRT